MASRTGVVWLAVTTSSFASRKTPAILVVVAASSATTRTRGACASGLRARPLATAAAGRVQLTVAPFAASGAHAAWW